MVETEYYSTSIQYTTVQYPDNTDKRCRAANNRAPERLQVCIQPKHRGTADDQPSHCVTGSQGRAGPPALPGCAGTGPRGCHRPLRFSAGSGPGPRAPSPPCQYTQPRPQGHTAPESGPSSGSESDGNKCTPGRPRARGPEGGPWLAAAAAVRGPPADRQCPAGPAP